MRKQLVIKPLRFMRNQHDKKRFLEKLSTTPIVSVVCRNTNINKATIYRWLQKDEVFAKQYDNALKEGRNTVNDLAESQTISAIKSGEKWAVQFWLINNHETYYRPKKAQDYHHEYLGVAKIIYESVPDRKYDANLNEIPPTSESPPSPS
jgi:hypothetical protein